MKWWLAGQMSLLLKNAVAFAFFTSGNAQLHYAGLQNVVIGVIYRCVIDVRPHRRGNGCPHPLHNGETHNGYTACTSQWYANNVTHRCAVVVRSHLRPNSCSNRQHNRAPFKTLCNMRTFTMVRQRLYTTVRYRHSQRSHITTASLF
jgi:hypothetical protein